MKLFVVLALSVLGLASAQNNGFRGYPASGSPNGPSFQTGSNFGSSFGSYSSGAGSRNSNGAQIATVRLNNENNGDGTYRYDYETANQIQAREEGQLQQDSLVVKGSYSWLAPDGQMYTVNYVADANGYHPTGAHIQGQEAIERSIKFNAQEQQQSSSSSGSFGGGIQANRQNGGYSSGNSGSSSASRQYLPPSNGGY